MKKAVGFLTFFLALMVVTSRADQIVMQNGDTLYGRVLAMTTNTLVLQDENLGTVTLPRAKVSALVFGAATKASSSAPQLNVVSIYQRPAAKTPTTQQSDPDSDVAAMLRGIRDHTNLIEQVEGQVLGSASPEATSKFNELLDGLSSGQLDMKGLRAQAQTAADELKEYKKDLGPEFGAEADSYLAILNNFLQETASENSTTNSAAP
jgi:hypothetical protein